MIKISQKHSTPSNETIGSLFNMDICICMFMIVIQFNKGVGS